MGKVKVNLISGNVVEKPVVTSFRNANGEYAILDNETNGSMGLPIICISKYNGEELQKIYDPSEWNAVKETLKSIIAGNSADYINIKSELRANDDFFTQLSLPVASFDTLKSQYAPNNEAVVSPIEEPVVSEVEVKVESPIVNNAAMPIPDIKPVDLPMPDVNPNPEVNVPSPEVQMPAPEMPTVHEAEVSPDMTISEISKPESEPAIAKETSSSVQSDEIEKIKASFLKACENMFDALLHKLDK